MFSRKLHLHLGKTISTLSALAFSTLLTPTFADEVDQNIMYVGDSLTHGYSSSSYRWHLHKVLIDSGRVYTELGILTGNTGKNQLKAGSSYRGQLFENVHSAQSSARSWEISGLRAGPRFQGTHLENWLGLDDKTAAGKSYTGKTFAGEQAPDIFVLMIGTNDLLSDNEREKGGLPAVAAREIKELLANVKKISKSMRKANPKAVLYLCTVPAWANHRTVGGEEWREAVVQYNKKLTAWAKGQKNIILVDVNRGLVGEGLTAHPDFYIADGIHFNEQGNLLIAGNIAEAMRLPTRTAGLSARLAKELKNDADASKDEAITAIMNPQISATYTLATGQKAATLKLTPHAIIWQSGNNAKMQQALYAGDISKTKRALRVAWVKGDPANNIAEGFYVWLGNQLIGEALPAESDSSSAKGITASEKRGLIVCDRSGSYAPHHKVNQLPVK